MKEIYKGITIEISDNLVNLINVQDPDMNFNTLMTFIHQGLDSYISEGIVESIKGEDVLFSVSGKVPS